MTTSACSAAATGLPNTPRLDPSTFPDIYGMNVAGSCLAPEIPDGCKIKVSKIEPWGFGDIVVVWIKPELLRPGAFPAMVKRVAMMPPRWVKDFPYRENPKSEVQALLCLSRNDKPDEMMTIRCSAIAAVRRCLGILRPEEIDPQYREAAEQERHPPAKRRRRKEAASRRRVSIGTTGPIRLRAEPHWS